MSMAETRATVASAETSSGLFAEGVGGIATVVLAVIALSGVSPGYLLSISTVIFGAALIIEGTSMATTYMHVVSAGNSAEGAQSGINGILAVFLGGISGIVLGVLALLGIRPDILVAAAIITYGGATILGSSSCMVLSAMKLRSAGMARDEGLTSVISNLNVGAAGAQVLVGLSAVILGILALAGGGGVSTTLELVALLALGAVILITGNGMSNAMLSLFQSPQRSYTPR